MDSSTESKNSFFNNIKEFPPIINGRINLVHFLEASNDLVSIVARFGKLLAPVKYDMQGNIDKIKKFYVFDEASCLLEVMLDEINNGKSSGAEGILWLNRALLFFELIFEGILKNLQASNYEINMTKIYTEAYEGSVKTYHNWVTQQLFALICKMSPPLSQILKSLEAENMNEFETKLASFNQKLNAIRCQIDDFFNANKLFVE